MFNFNDWMLSKKIKVGFGVVLTLMVIVAGVGEWGLTGAADGFDEYRATARVRNSLARVNSAALAVRLALTKFDATGNADFQKKFEEEYEVITKGFAEAKERLEKEFPEGKLRDDSKAQVENVEKKAAQYKEGGDKLFALRGQHDSLVDTLNKLGPEIEHDLTAIMTTASGAGEASAANHAALSLRDLLLMRLYVTKFMDDSQEKYAARVGEEYEKLQANMKSLDAALQSADLRKTFSDAKTKAEEYNKKAGDLIASIKGMDELFHGTFDVIGPEVVNQIDEVQNGMKDRQDALGPAVRAANHRATIVALASTVIALVVGILLAWKIGAAIIGPLKEMSSVIAQVAKGDFTVRVDVKRQDEIGMVGKDVNNLCQTLQASLGEVLQTTGVLNEASNSLSAVANQLASGAEETTHQSSAVASASEQITANVASVNRATDNMAREAGAIAAAAEEMSTSVNTVATAIEEMTSSMQEVAKNTARASQIAQDASTKAKETNAIMEALDNAAREIGNVVTVISDIADQTNLLALNATIEAASAGEAGKGFAVVAHEVKELAKQTADATREIGEKIRLVQEQTHASVGAIQSINGTIDEISQISVVIASAIEEQNATTREVSRSVSGAATGAGEVTHSVQKLNTAIEQEVLRGIQEASAGVTQVSQNILGVNAAAQQTAQGADTTRRSAEQMTNLAKNLERVVAQFHV